MNEVRSKKVAIIGAGFGGISAAKVLAKSQKFEIHIIDRRNHHLFQPLLYQVAMAGLNPSEIAIPIRKLFSQKQNVHITLAEVEDVDIKSCKIFYDKEWKFFDYMILATGAKHFYFGKNEWEQIAPGLKNIEQATEIRRRILTAFELAEKEKDSKAQSAYLTFAIVGGGPTGVELAGAISEMARNTLMADYKNADLSQTKVYLIESGPRVLPVFPEKLSRRAEEDLRELGVRVLNNVRATDLSVDGLKAGDQWIATKTIIWAAGVKPSSLIEKVNAPKDSSGRIIVEKDLSIKNYPNIFAVGDVAHFPTKEGRGLPGIAPVAIQEGQFVGKLIFEGRKYIGDFKYKDKGIMATIGRSKAVVYSGSFQLSGAVAWLAWVFIHIIYLMRFKNRVFIFFQWVWAYFNFGRGARLITHKTWRFYDGKKISYGIDEEEG